MFYKISATFDLVFKWHKVKVVAQIPTIKYALNEQHKV